MALARSVVPLVGSDNELGQGDNVGRRRYSGTAA